MNELVDLVAVTQSQTKRGNIMYTGTARVHDGGMWHDIRVNLFGEHINAIERAGYTLATNDDGNLLTPISVIMEPQSTIGARKIQSVQTIFRTMVSVDDRNERVLHVNKITHKYTAGILADDFICETLEGITVHVIRNDLRTDTFHAFAEAGYEPLLLDIVTCARDGKMVAMEDRPPFIPTEPIPILVRKNERGFWDVVRVKTLDFAEAA